MSNLKTKNLYLKSQMSNVKTEDKMTNDQRLMTNQIPMTKCPKF